MVDNENSPARGVGQKSLDSPTKESARPEKKTRRAGDVLREVSFQQPSKCDHTQIPSSQALKPLPEIPQLRVSQRNAVQETEDLIDSARPRRRGEVEAGRRSPLSRDRRHSLLSPKAAVAPSPPTPVVASKAESIPARDDTPRRRGSLLGLVSGLLPSRSTGTTASARSLSLSPLR
jgi:hypothetical protein